MDPPDTRYTKTNDGAHVAYQVLGSGPIDVLCLGYGNVISIDTRDEEPHLRRFEHRLASFSRLIRFDPQGIGLSDPMASGSTSSIEQWVDAAIAVLDAAESPRAALYATGNSGSAALVAAASYPERTSALVLIHCYARLARADDYPFGVPQRLIDGFLDAVLDTNAERGVEVDDAGLMAPSLGSDPEYRAWWKRAGQRGASPAMARAVLAAELAADVRAVLSLISAPTLVVHRVDNTFMSIGHSRYLAESIPGAHLVELPGTDHMPYAGDSDGLVDEMEEFLTGARRPPDPDRVLATVLFTDIVGSTERAAELGDQSWRQVLDRHDAMTRRQLERFGGREVKTTGDGFLATFDGAARAIHCGEALRDGAHQLGLLVRVGIHTGELERRGDDIGGIAVHIASRVQALAAPGEVLVSRTVVDLVAGSGIEFEGRGEHNLKGVRGTWQLFSAIS